MKNIFVEEFKPIYQKMTNVIDFLDYADEIIEVCSEIYGQDFGYLIYPDEFYVLHNGNKRSTFTQVKRLNEALRSFKEIEKYSSPYPCEGFPAVVGCYGNYLSIDESVLIIITNEPFCRSVIKSEDGMVESIINLAIAGEPLGQADETFIEKFAFSDCYEKNKIDLTKYAEIIFEACYDVIGNGRVSVTPQGFYIAYNGQNGCTYVQERYLNKVLFSQPEIDKMCRWYDSTLTRIGVEVTERLSVNRELSEFIESFYYDEAIVED